VRDLQNARWRNAIASVRCCAEAYVIRARSSTHIFRIATWDAFAVSGAPSGGIGLARHAIERSALIRSLQENPYFWRFMRETRALFVLAAPIVCLRVGTMAMSVVDTIMAGAISTNAVAALGLATMCFWFGVVWGLGTLLGMEPHVAQAVGAGDLARARRTLGSARWLSLAISVPVIGATLAAPWALGVLGQPTELLGDVRSYLYVASLAVAPVLLFNVYGSYLAAHHRTRIFVAITIVANLLNVLGNFVFIHGRFGVPAMGVTGIAMSTVICHTFELLCVVWALSRIGVHRTLRVAWRWADWRLMRPVLRSGVPIGAQYLLEFTGFAAATVMVGWFGTHALAGHHIALNIGSVTFCAGLGLSGAAAVRAGHAVGKGDAQALRVAAVAAWVWGGFAALVCAFLMIRYASVIVGVYAPDYEAARYAVMFLVVVAAFQLADTCQVVGFGLLRGTGDTTVPAMFNVVGYWCIALPVGATMAFGVRDDPVWVWWGLFVGLSCVAVALVVRFRWRLRHFERSLRVAAGAGSERGDHLVEAVEPGLQ